MSRPSPLIEGDPSKYFPEAMELLSSTRARVAFVVVIDGDRGTGGGPAFVVPTDPATGKTDEKHLGRLEYVLGSVLRTISDDLLKRAREHGFRPE